MKLEEISKWNDEYIEKCICGKSLKVFTQEDDRPEYHTHIYIPCECGEYIQFILPVN